MDTGLTYKVSSKYVYSGDKQIIGLGDVFRKDATYDYEDIEGLEFTIKEAGQLFLAVDKLFYDICNQWEDGMDIEEFVGKLRKTIYD